jgi:hypothetical protein
MDLRLGKLLSRDCLHDLCARWRGTGPDVLNNLPNAVWLAFEDDYVAAFGSELSAGSDGGQGFLEVAAVVGETAGGFEVLAVEGEVAVEGGHYVLEEGTKGGGASDAFASGLEEDGVWGIKLQDRFELFGAKVLDPGFAELSEGYQSRGLGSGEGCGGKSRREDGGEGQEHYGSATRTGESRQFGWSPGKDVHGDSPQSESLLDFKHGADLTPIPLFGNLRNNLGAGFSRGKRGDEARCGEATAPDC